MTENKLVGKYQDATTQMRINSIDIAVLQAISDIQSLPQSQRISASTPQKATKIGIRNLISNQFKFDESSVNLSIKKLENTKLITSTSDFGINTFTLGKEVYKLTQKGTGVLQKFARPSSPNNQNTLIEKASTSSPQ